MAGDEKKKAGRPTSYTKAMGNMICARLIGGESLRRICSDEGLPDKGTVFRWLSANAAFRNQYTRAREFQADGYADEVVDIADESCTVIRKVVTKGANGKEKVTSEVVFDMAAIAHKKLRIDARKWSAAQQRPKVYGPKTDPYAINPDDDVPLPVSITVNVKDASRDEPDA